MCGVTMGSPLSPIISNLFIEHFEKNEINSFPLKPKYWVRFVDDTFVIWPHGNENLLKLLDHLNNLSEDIEFTMDIEEIDNIPLML